MYVGDLGLGQSRSRSRYLCYYPRGSSLYFFFLPNRTPESGQSTCRSPGGSRASIPPYNQTVSARALIWPRLRNPFSSSSFVHPGLSRTLPFFRSPLLILSCACACGRHCPTRSCITEQPIIRRTDPRPAERPSPRLSISRPVSHPHPIPSHPFPSLPFSS